MLLDRELFTPEDIERITPTVQTNYPRDDVERPLNQAASVLHEVAVISPAEVTTAARSMVDAVQAFASTIAAWKPGTTPVTHLYRVADDAIGSI